MTKGARLARLHQKPSPSKINSQTSELPPLLLPDELEFPEPELAVAATDTDTASSTLDTPSESVKVNAVVLGELELGAVKVTEAAVALDKVTDGPEVCAQA